jgi:hypothetical protein
MACRAYIFDEKKCSREFRCIHMAYPAEYVMKNDNPETSPTVSTCHV